MAKITNDKYGAGGAAAPVSFTVKQIMDKYGIKSGADVDGQKYDGTTGVVGTPGYHIRERDKADVSGNTFAAAVYIYAFSDNEIKVVLKATADAVGEGNNPLKQVKTFTDI